MSLTGKFLIAHPNCPKNSFFHRSVIYLYQDSPLDGSVGIVINKPSKFMVRDVCDEKGIQFIGADIPIYHGGPVSTNSLVLLHTNDWASVNTVEVGNQLRISSDNNMLLKIANVDQPKKWKIFGGFSAWAPNQLTAELSGKWPYRPENSWLIASADTALIFDTPSNQIWNQAFKLCGSQMFDQYF